MYCIIPSKILKFFFFVFYKEGGKTNVYEVVNSAGCNNTPNIFFSSHQMDNFFSVSLLNDFSKNSV